MIGRIKRTWQDDTAIGNSSEGGQVFISVHNLAQSTDYPEA